MTAEQCHICGEPASYTCNQCQRPVCAEHYLDSSHGLWAGACRQCLEETEPRTWEDLTAREEPTDDSPTPDTPAPSDSPDAQSVPALPKPPTPDRGYRARWLLAAAFTMAMVLLVALSLQAGQLLGALLFGGLGATVVWAMRTRDFFRSPARSPASRTDRDRRPGPAAQTEVDLHLRGLLNQHQDRVFTYLGRPAKVADLSRRGGALSDQAIYNLEYYSKGLRFYRRAQPEILSIHFIHSGFDSYQTYPREILPGLRVGMTRREIDALLGPPEPEDPGSKRGKWKTYATDALPPPIGNLEVFYTDADDPDAASVIIAIG